MWEHIRKLTRFCAVATSIPILMFHAIDNSPSVISFSSRFFERGMARLCDLGYRTLSLLEVGEYLLRGDLFPERSLAITFDGSSGMLSTMSVRYHARPRPVVARTSTSPVL